jgi:hypothetical protein
MGDSPNSFIASPTMRSSRLSMSISVIRLGFPHWNPKASASANFIAS